jgi:hypothetical protein
MDESKKKPIMIGVIVVCLVAAGAIFYATSGGGGGGLEDIAEGEQIWVKCNNKACGVEYQMGKKDYFKYVQQNIDPLASSAPPLVCQKCNQKSVFRAEKCPNCGKVFFYGAAGAGDFSDRCTYCKFSATEESRKRAKAAAGGS